VGIEIALSKLPSTTDLSAVLGALGHDAPDEASAASLDLFQRYSGGLEDVRQLWKDMVSQYHQRGCSRALKHHAGFGESNP
jgi:hypothetical protein